MEQQVKTVSSSTSPKRTKWKLYQILNGHCGYVRAIAVCPTNGFFVSASFDSSIRVWNMSNMKHMTTLVGC